MERIIQVTVNGCTVRKSSRSAGAQGEVNVTGLHLTLDGSWAGYGKRIVWRNALGENPVSVVLFNGSGEDSLSYDTLIPAEPLAQPGLCSFTVEGYRLTDGARHLAIAARDELEVLASDGFPAPAEPTPGEKEQILDALGKAETAVAASAREARSWAIGGTGSRAGEDLDNAKYYAGQAASSAGTAAGSASSASAAAQAAQTARAGAETAGAGAERAKTGAESAEKAAAASAAAAESSAGQADRSARSAAASETAAKGSETAAKQAAAEAKGSETAARASETAAGASETAARASAERAAASEKAVEELEVSAETVDPGGEARVEKTLQNGHYRLHFQIPRGEPGNLMLPVFDLDPATGDLYLYADLAYAGPDFRLRGGNLEVVVNV